MTTPAPIAAELPTAEIIEGLRAVQSGIGPRQPAKDDQPDRARWDAIDAACSALTAHASAAERAVPTWEALHHAWKKVGADIAGLNWGAFTHAVHYAPSGATAAPVQQAAPAQPAPAQEGERDYPPLPECDATTVGLGEVWNRHSMRAYVDTDRASRAAAPVAPAMREAVAKAIYDQWSYQDGWVKWVERGNSLRQDDARDLADVALATAPQPTAPAATVDALDAARWRWLGEHITVAWDEGKFTSLVRIVSEKNRNALNAAIDQMMAGVWSDSDAAQRATHQGDDK
ncbi:hypothetical protein [Acidovorax sp. NB1]|uniref:hypothetical protein n=1 Tax=Acidovorax sp. NB1 TaxID=1943571 RepID=UPI0010DC8A73|nr:hypothetical protein [Acidovorax sp. NB1]GDY37744.1 hypothetical protein ACINB_36360 [Acidovorax sp. NB1]